MGMFDYRDFDSESIMQDSLTLFTYLAEAMVSKSTTERTFDDYNKNGAWRALMPEDIGHSGIGWDPDSQTFRGELPAFEGVQVQLLGKYDHNGELTSIGFAYWGMNGELSEALTTTIHLLGPDGMAHSFVQNAYDYLLTTVAQFATDNGLTGRDIIVSGASMGGLCVNSMASASAQGQWNEFYEDSAYIAYMSLTQNDLDDKVLNIGLENDPVFRVAEGDSIHWENIKEHLNIHDKPLDTCTNNITIFDNYYSVKGWQSILNPINWLVGHTPYMYEKAVNAIIESDYYKFTNINSTVIVSTLSDEYRAVSWVQDYNYNALPHTGPTFIIGSKQDDLILGGKGIDYLEGNGGNDTFRDQGGYNLIDGGDGIDTYDTQDHFDYKSWTRDAFGMTWVRDKEGNVSVLNNVEQVKGGYAGWFGIGWNEINGTFTDDGIAFTYAGKSGFKAYSETAQGDIYKGSEVIAHAAAKGESGFLFGGFGNDTLVGSNSDEVFFAHEGNDTLYLGGGKDVVMTVGENFGHDKIYQFDKNDKLVFMLNSKMETDTSVLEYMSVAGNDIVFSFDDNNSVTLVGGASSNLTNDQFVCG